jgi:hypothetical protein
MTKITLQNLVLTTMIQTVLWGGALASANADQPAEAGAPKSQALAEAIQAHGGLDTWQSYARMDYTTKDFPLGANAPFDFTQTTDLRNRHHVTHGKGFTSGKNADTAWALPNTEALGIPPAFFESGNFYFITMPFVFADPGVIARDIGQATFQDRTYDLVAITYPAHIGDTPEDDYILYIDAETHRLRMIDFVPTSAEVNGDTPKEDLPRKALIFNDWNRYGGLLIPSKATFYGWADGQLHGDGNTYTIQDVSFSKTAPKPSMFLTQNSRVIQSTANVNNE